MYFNIECVLFFTSCKYFGNRIKEERNKDNKENRKSKEQLQLKQVDVLLERTVD